MDKQAVRQRVWDELEAEGIARFPFPPHDRIPNFEGAGRAAERLADTPEWDAAATLKSNPDAPQLPVRRRALRDGKRLYVAQPRLRDPEPFLEIDPGELRPGSVDDATTVSGIGEHGRAVGPAGMPSVELVVAGSVAVTERGARIGKGEGYSDLEWAVLAEFGAVGDGTVVATTVHERQVFDPGKVPEPEPHDVPLDLVVTPERTVRTGTRYDRPSGVDWERLEAGRADGIPVLRRLGPD